MRAHLSYLCVIKFSPASIRLLCRLSQYPKFVNAKILLCVQCLMLLKKVENQSLSLQQNASKQDHNAEQLWLYKKVSNNQWSINTVLCLPLIMTLSGGWRVFARTEKMSTRHELVNARQLLSFTKHQTFKDSTSANFAHHWPKTPLKRHMNIATGGWHRMWHGWAVRANH